MISALIRSYGITDFLKPVLKQYDWLDKVLVMNYRFKTVDSREDRTEEVIKELNQPNVQIIKGVDLDQHEVLNLGINELRDSNLIFIADADEIITREDQNKLVNGMEAHDIGVCNIIDYAKDNRRYPVRTHRPVVIVKPNVRFYDVRCYMGGAKYFPDINLHHFGYTCSKEDLAWKLNWEKKWEKEGVFNVINRVSEKCEIPEEVLRMICG